jgi:hypothetical protein
MPQEQPSPFIDEMNPTEAAKSKLSSNTKSLFAEKVILVIGNKPLELDETTKVDILSKLRSCDAASHLASSLKALHKWLKCPECFTALKKIQGRQCDYLKCDEHGRKHGLKLLPQFPTEILSAFIERADKSKLIENLSLCFPDRAPALKDLLPGGKQTGINKFFLLSELQEESTSPALSPSASTGEVITSPELTSVPATGNKLAATISSDEEYSEPLSEATPETFAQKWERELNAALSENGLVGIISKVLSILVAQNEKIVKLEAALAAKPPAYAPSKSQAVPQATPQLKESYLDVVVKGNQLAIQNGRKVFPKLSQREINKVIDAPAGEIIPLTTYHLKGFKKGPVKTIKAIFREANISHGAVNDLAWVGNNIAEIIAPENRKEEVISKLKNLSKLERYSQLRIEEINFDAIDEANIRSETETRRPEDILKNRLEKKVIRLTETVKTCPVLTKTLNYVKKQLQLNSLVVPIYKPPVNHYMVSLEDLVDKAQKGAREMEILPTPAEAEKESLANTSAPNAKPESDNMEVSAATVAEEESVPEHEMHQEIALESLSSENISVTVEAPLPHYE